MDTLRQYFENHNTIPEKNLEIVIKAIDITKERKCNLVFITLNRTSDVVDKMYPGKMLNQFTQSLRQKGIGFKVETINTYKLHTDKEVCIVFYPRQENLDKLDELIYGGAIIAVELRTGDFEEWKRRWGLIKTSSVLSQNLKNGICILAKSVNVTTGFAHPSDDKMARTYARVIFKYEPDANLEDIRSYLISVHHFDPSDAKIFTDLIDKFRNGGYIQGGEKTGLQKIYKIWQNYKD
jgi:hypothetical protein